MQLYYILDVCWPSAFNVLIMIIIIYTHQLCLLIICIKYSMIID